MSEERTLSHELAEVMAFLQSAGKPEMSSAVFAAIRKIHQMDQLEDGMARIGRAIGRAKQATGEAGS